VNILATVVTSYYSAWIDAGDLAETAQSLSTPLYKC